LTGEDLGCRPAGTRRVRTGTAIQGRHDPTELRANGWGYRKQTDDRGYADPDGLETVAAWECVEGCVVAELDRMSGERKAGWFSNAERRGLGYRGAESNADGERPATCLSDTGGASRFYATFGYFSKASRADRNEGLEGMPVAEVKIGAERHKINPMTGRPVVDVPRANHHPTVKNTDLMRWLCRLVTPEGGVVLDPFMGSGSTGKACVLEGLSFIGIERDPEYHAIAKARIDAARAAAPLFAGAAPR
jgi:hypothetical protein